MTVKVPAKSVPQSLHRLGPRGSWISQQCSLVLIPWFGDRVLSLRGTVRELQRSSSAASFSQQDQPSRTPLSDGSVSRNFHRGADLHRRLDPIFEHNRNLTFGNL